MKFTCKHRADFIEDTVTNAHFRETEPIVPKHE